MTKVLSVLTIIVSVVTFTSPIFAEEKKVKCTTYEHKLKYLDYDKAALCDGGYVHFFGKEQELNSVTVMVSLGKAVKTIVVTGLPDEISKFGKYVKDDIWSNQAFVKAVTVAGGLQKSMWTPKQITGFETRGKLIYHANVGYGGGGGAVVPPFKPDPVEPKKDDGNAAH